MKAGRSGKSQGIEKMKSQKKDQANALVLVNCISRPSILGVIVGFASHSMSLTTLPFQILKSELSTQKVAFISL